MGRFYHYTQWPFHQKCMLQTFSSCILKTAKQARTANDHEPTGCPTRIIFLPCRFSVEKCSRKAEDPLSSAPRLAYLPPLGLQADLPRGAIFSCGFLSAETASCTLANHGWRKIDLQSHTCEENVLFFRSLMLFMLYLAATAMGTDYCVLANYTGKLHLIGLGLLWWCILGYRNNQWLDLRASFPTSCFLSLLLESST